MKTTIRDLKTRFSDLRINQPDMNSSLILNNINKSQIVDGWNFMIYYYYIVEDSPFKISLRPRYSNSFLIGKNASSKILEFRKVYEDIPKNYLKEFKAEVMRFIAANPGYKLLNTHVYPWLDDMVKFI